MATDTPYIRQAKLTVFPAGGGQGQEFFSDGSRDSYYLAFDATKSLMDAANDGTFTLKNLTAKTRQKMRDANLRVQLQAGWSTGGLRTVYVGNLMRAITVRQGPDVVTTLKCITAGDSLLTATVSETWLPGTPIPSVLHDLVNELDGVGWDNSRVSASLRQLQIGPGGWSRGGMVRDALDSLANEFGFTWSVQNGTFQALADGTAFGRTLVLSSEAGTLFQIVPTLTTAFQLKLGVEVDALMVPELLPGDSCQVTSTVAPDLSGVYMMNKIQYTGSPNENDWRMHLTAFAMGG